MYGPFNPDYGYPDSVRLKVCRTAVSQGIKTAAKQHNVSIPSVYVWLKAYSAKHIMESGNEQVYNRGITKRNSTVTVRQARSKDAA